MEFAMRLIPKVFIVSFFLMIYLFNGDLYSQQFNNYLLYPSTISQTEPVIVNHPFEQNTIFVSANTIRFYPFFVSEGVYLSQDGGVSWSGSDTCKGEYINFHGGDPSIAITKSGRFILSRLGRYPFVGLYVHTSDDRGATWSFQKQINDHDLERAVIVADNFQSSPFFGRVYAFWVRFNPPYAMYFSYSDDDGVNWSQPQQINNPVQRCAGGDVAIGKNGEIFVTWAVVSSTSPFYEQFIGFAKSTNGGSSWIVTEKAFQVNGIQGMLPEKQNIRVNGLPAIVVDTSGGTRDGWLYIVTSQKNFGAAGNDPDIILYRSTDGGNNWSNPVRVNQDELNNGKIQYFPALCIDKFGGLNVLYYDDRLTTSDSVGVFLSRSTDGGITFSDFQVSDHNFKPVAIGGLGQGYQGDLIALSSSENFLIPVWMDNKTGIYQLWTTRININRLVNVETGDLDFFSFELQQNFPNPFNSETQIGFEIPESNLTSLKVYDLLGREIKTLVNEILQKGSYSIKFSAAALSSGIYIYELKSGKFRSMKKMIYLK